MMNASLDIRKTYKLYIDGKFSRTESGRFMQWVNTKDNQTVNFCRASRKDFRNAVLSSRNAFNNWKNFSGYNRGQILYRIAEMLNSRKEQFISELLLQGKSKKQSIQEIQMSIDRLIYYAGWSDKYQQVFSRVNPVSTPHYNFSLPEPTGVISIIAPKNSYLLGFISVIVPALVGGNTVVVLASEDNPLCAISFSEVLHSSDVPNGVINILSGFRHELIDHFSSHMDVNAVIYCGSDINDSELIKKNSSLNVKRVFDYGSMDWAHPDSQDPYLIMDCQEVKTTWHPIGY
ncbi:MAG: aldehyde dehydrogenase family protein [Candidatus Neomarinimicrobiota bacterium]|nr:aldehyde dehydrogenase family protein [Candidatus Neomarinimicrobiota bacterium]MEC9106134.1 aldehyde dehydrogenase family protein [Candidatus Neomarinimicrobiota bacterium]